MATLRYRDSTGSVRGPRRVAFGALAGILTSALLVAAPVAPAAHVAAAGPGADILVTGTSEGAGDCATDPDGIIQCSTLRAAVGAANATEGASIGIPAGTYELTAALTLTGAGTHLRGAAAPVSVAGGGVIAGDATLIDANGASQAIVVDADDVVISGVAITGATGGRRTGGGIVVERRTSGFVLSDSTIIANTGAEGAGVNIERNASGVIERSTFVGNAADGKGGGLRVDGTVDVVNSTFTDNTAQSGGAISVAGSATISYSTFVDNTSNNSKGGGVDRNGGDLAITGSILTQAQQSGSDGSDCSGTPDLVGVNYVGNAQGCNPGPDTLTRATDGPLAIEPLAGNGGPTQTIAQLDDSPAVDVPGLTTCQLVGPAGLLGGVLDVDQRGLTRPGGSAEPARCDLGAFEINPLEVELALTTSTDTPQVGASTIPAENFLTAITETEALFDSTTEASPLRAFPLRAFPLRAFPLRAFDTVSAPLRAFPLRAFLTTSTPLRAFDTTSFPLRAFPLDSVNLSDLILLTEGGWPAVLEGTPLADAPLQSITLSDIQALLDSGVLVDAKQLEIENLDFADLNVESTPLRAFPLRAFLLLSVPLRAFGDPATTEPCISLRDFCTSVDLDTATLSTAALAGESLQDVEFTETPLGSFLDDTTRQLEPFPLRAFPLRAFDLLASPLRAFPLRAFPLRAFEGPDPIIDCSVIEDNGIVPCEDATLGDVSTLDAWTDGAELAELIELIAADPALAAEFDTYGLEDLLVTLLPPASVAWERLDLTTPGLQNGADPLVDPFQYFAAVTTSGPADTATVEVALPTGFAYVPGGSRVDGVTVADPTLSFGTADGARCGAGEDQVVLTYELANLPAGTTTVEIDARAGLTLGTAATSACVVATAGPRTVGADASAVVTVIEDPDAPPSDIRPLTITSDSIESGVDVNLGYVTGDDNVDLYSFTVPQEAADLGIQGDLFLDNLPADYDMVLFGPKSIPLRDEPLDTIGFIDGVLFDLNPFDDRVQADPVEDVPQTLPASIDPTGDFVPIAIAAQRSTTAEQIQTGTLRGDTTYYVQISGYNDSLSNEPYSLRFQTTQSLQRPECAALGTPTGIAPGTLPDPGSIPSGTNTLFVVNEQLLRYTYGTTEAERILTAVQNVADADQFGVIGTIVPVDGDSVVREKYDDRAGSPCEPERSNDVVREIGRVLDSYTDVVAGIENIVLIGDDRQIPFANLLDDANYANERSFAQGFVGNNESIAALVAGRYRSDDPYGTSAGVRVRDRELFVPERAVGRLLEDSDEIIRSLTNFITFEGRLDPTTERTSLQTGYEFLEDGAALNVANLENGGYTVTEVFGETWRDSTLSTALATPDPIDVIGLHAHFDENNLLPAFDNFNPTDPSGDLFSSDEFTRDRSIVYSMGCHAGWSLSDIQVAGASQEPSGGAAQQPDWAQRATGELDNVFAGNTGFGYGDSAKAALAELLTAEFALQIAQDGPVGQAWVDAKQQALADTHVLDAYQEKTLQQFVLYGLPMFHVGDNPPDLAAAGFGDAFAEFRTTLSASTLELSPGPAPGLQVANVVADQPVESFEENVVAGDGTFFSLDGKTIDVDGRPIQPLSTTDISHPDYTARGALITGLTSTDVSPGTFDPVFFRAATDTGQPRPEYFDGSFPAELSTIRDHRADGGPRQQLNLAVGQFQSSPDLASAGVGTQRLHTRIETEVYYGAGEPTDPTPPSIDRSRGFIDDNVIFFEVEVSDPESDIARVYALYRGSNTAEWTGLDLSFVNGAWRGGRPFFEPEAEFALQVVNDQGLTSISDNKSLFFLTADPDVVDELGLRADGPSQNGWFTGPVTVTAQRNDIDALDADPEILVSVDGGVFEGYPGPFEEAREGAHAVTAIDESDTGGFAVLYFAIDTTGPDGSVFAPTGFVGGPVDVTAAFDDGVGSGVARIDAFDDATDESLGTVEFADALRRGSLTLDGLTGDGDLTIRFVAVDDAGNTTTERATVSFDTTAPTVVVTKSPDTTYANGPVTVTVDATDDRSGVASTGFTTDRDTTTPRPSGDAITEEGTTIVTGFATDVVGNIGVSDPLTVQIDLTDPTAVATLASETGQLGTPLRVTYNCADLAGIQPSGVETCEISSTATIVPTSVPPTTAGGEVDVVADAIGSYDVTVTATDRAGNTFSATETFGVGYGICLQYDPTQAKNAGSNYTIRLILCDGDGNDLGSRRITLTAMAINPGNIPPGPNDSGQANKRFEFRFRNDGYIYNLDTSGLPAGDLTLDFTVSGDPSGLTYSAPFRLR